MQPPLSTTRPLVSPEIETKIQPMERGGSQHPSGRFVRGQKKNNTILPLAIGKVDIDAENLKVDENEQVQHFIRQAKRFGTVKALDLQLGLV